MSAGVISAKSYEETLSKEHILKDVTQEQIFMRYLGSLPLRAPILSPLRAETNPSFTVFYDKNNILRYKDFGSGESGDCFDFVQTQYNLSWPDTLKKINHDKSGIKKIKVDNVKEYRSAQSIKKFQNSPNKTIEIVPKKFSVEELAYWKKFGISLETLNKYNVESCKYVYINKDPYIISTESQPVFSYKVNNKYKIYRPLSEKGKWWSNLGTTDIFGYDQLPMWGDILIITKSLKDIMVLDTLGYTSISPQSESQFNFMDGQIWLTLQKRFKKFLVLYDCDKAGYTMGKRLANRYNIDINFVHDHICVFKKNSAPKDISDYYLVLGKKATIKRLDKITKTLQ